MKSASGGFDSVFLPDTQARGGAGAFDAFSFSHAHAIIREYRNPTRTEGVYGTTGRDESHRTRAERAYTARVRALLEALITQSEALAGSHTESIRAILADAWDELRVRPTALSPSELRQLSADVDRFTARRQLASETSERARRMLDEPFFARVDFAEVGTSAPERIVIGLYSLADAGRKPARARLARADLQPVLRRRARPGVLCLPVRRDLRHDDAQAPVPHGARRAEVLCRHPPEHRR